MFEYRRRLCVTPAPIIRAGGVGLVVNHEFWMLASVEALATSDGWRLVEVVVTHKLSMPRLDARLPSLVVRRCRRALANALPSSPGTGE